MNGKSETGKIGEDLACEYLINRGYKIIRRNYRQKWGELDIIAKDPANTLVFVEVKAMRQNNAAIHPDRSIGVAELSPEDNLTAAKLIKTKRAASMYAGFHEDLIDESRGWRIDLVAIYLPSGKIKHYENL